MLPIAIGTNEAIIIVGVIVLLFGIKKLPELGRSLAEGIHEFKKASRKAQEETDSSKPESESSQTAGKSE
ncbi:MAG: twin-arginine translocase TatA/TatE family subunit [Armatimonadetes bacterium]|nr:twin-arginine translocase TatA/TatE family subunit [Armatimonadota bacterium]